MIYAGNEINLLIQGFIAIIIIGMIYSLWVTTRAYGGLIGRALRFIGFGIMFISIAVLEKMLVNFGVIQSSSNLSLAQDSFTLIGLVLVSFGFSKLAAASRQ